MAAADALMTFFEQEVRCGRSRVRMEPETRKNLADYIASRTDRGEAADATAAPAQAAVPGKMNPRIAVREDAPSNDRLMKSKEQVPPESVMPKSFLEDIPGDEKPTRYEAILEHLRNHPKPSGLEKCRNKLVAPTGNLDAKIAFVGEAPGADEEEQGEPFVGRAGELLTKMIQAMGLERSDVFICNVLLYRPAVGGALSGQMSGNRPPTPQEMTAGLPQLLTFLDLVRPEVVVCLGLSSVKALLKKPDAVMNRMRNVWHEITEPFPISVMPTYHPSYLLRNQVVTEKRKVWEDLLKVMEKTGMSISEKQRGFFLKK